MSTTKDQVHECLLQHLQQQQQQQAQKYSASDAVTDQPCQVSVTFHVSIMTSEEGDVALLKDKGCSPLIDDINNSNNVLTTIHSIPTSPSSETNKALSTHDSPPITATIPAAITPSTPDGELPPSQQQQEQRNSVLFAVDEEIRTVTPPSTPELSNNKAKRKNSIFNNKGLSFLTETTSNIIRRRTFCLSEPRIRRNIRSQFNYINEGDDSEDFFIDNSNIKTLSAGGNTDTLKLRPPRSRRSSWLIPAEHPLKVLWDVLTVLLSFANAYCTHIAIRDRQFNKSGIFVRFCEVWFICDILLNFVTQYKYKHGLLNRFEAVWARYLTTWFVIDALSLFPGEILYIQPIIEQQKKRGFLQKSFFRTKAVVRVTRILRGRHVKLLQMVARGTGVGASRLVRIIIKYLPKYLMFIRNMRGLVAVRVLRQVHWIRKAWYNVQWRKRIMRERQLAAAAAAAASCNRKDDDTHSLSEAYADEDWDDSTTIFQQHQQQPWRLHAGSAPLIDWDYYRDNIDDDNDIGPY